jgi:hypothetical protein
VSAANVAAAVAGTDINAEMARASGAHLGGHAESGQSGEAKGEECVGAKRLRTNEATLPDQSTANVEGGEGGGAKRLRTNEATLPDQSTANGSGAGVLGAAQTNMEAGGGDDGGGGAEGNEAVKLAPQKKKARGESY